MHDVARKAGVGLATVGRVLHRNGFVAEATRLAVEAAVRDLGYVPNQVARNLKSRRTKVWGHVTMFNPNQLFAGISRAVDEAAAQAGYRVITVATHQDRTPLEAQVRDLLEQQVEGIVFTSHAEVGNELIDMVCKAGVPVVMIERTLVHEGVDRVVVQDFRGAFDAVTHLVAHGHRRIGFIGRGPEQDVEARRWEGYRRALLAGGLGADPSLVALVPQYTVADGSAALGRLLDQPKPPTAVFLTSDVLAAGALQQAYARGLRVPEWLALVGYDNTLAALLSPALTSMALPLDRVGRLAVEFLRSRSENPALAPRTAGVRPLLVDRGTGGQTA